MGVLALLFFSLHASVVVGIDVVAPSPLIVCDRQRLIEQCKPGVPASVDCEGFRAAYEPWMTCAAALNCDTSTLLEGCVNGIRAAAVVFPVLGTCTDVCSGLLSSGNRLGGAEGRLGGLRGAGQKLQAASPRSGLIPTAQPQARTTLVAANVAIGSAVAASAVALPGSKPLGANTPDMTVVDAVGGFGLTGVAEASPGISMPPETVPMVLANRTDGKGERLRFRTIPYKNALGQTHVGSFESATRQAAHPMKTHQFALTGSDRELGYSALTPYMETGSTTGAPAPQASPLPPALPPAAPPAANMTHPAPVAPVVPVPNVTVVEPSPPEPRETTPKPVRHNCWVWGLC